MYTFMYKEIPDPMLFFFGLQDAADGSKTSTLRSYWAPKNSYSRPLLSVGYGPDC